MAKMIWLMTLWFTVSWCRTIQLTQEEAAKITRRDVTGKEFSEGTDNFVSGRVNVAKLLSDQEDAHQSRSVEEIKKELERAWRELHGASTQLDHHSILPKETEKGATKETDEDDKKRDMAQKTSQALPKSESDLRRRSSRMERLEVIVDDLLHQLESEDHQSREVADEMSKKSSGTKHLQKDIDALLEVSSELKDSPSQFKRQKLNGIGREVENSVSKDPINRESTKREAHELTGELLLARLAALHDKREQGTGEIMPPKFNGIGRELTPSEAFQELLRAYVKENLKRDSDQMQSSSTTANEGGDNMLIDAIRELIAKKKRALQGKVEETESQSRISTDKLINLLAARLDRDFGSPPMIPMKSEKAGKQSFSPPMIHMRREKTDIENAGSPPMIHMKKSPGSPPMIHMKKSPGSPPMIHMKKAPGSPPMIHMKKAPTSTEEGLDRSSRINLLKRAIALLELQRSLPFFKKSRQSDLQSELKEAKSLEGQSEDVRLAELKRRAAAVRLLQLYQKSQGAHQDSLERELSLVARDNFQVESDRFSSNSLGNSYRHRGPNTSSSSGSDSRLGHDINSLLNLHRDGVSQETVKTLEGFHKPATRELLDPPLSRVSAETSSTLSGFSGSDN